MSKVKSPKDMCIGNMYMYRRWNYWSAKLEVGKCVGITDKSATFKDIERPYLSDVEVNFIADRFAQEYSLIADYDKRIFNTYNKKIDDTCDELVNIWNGIDVVRRKKKRKKSWWKNYGGSVMFEVESCEVTWNMREQCHEILIVGTDGSRIFIGDLGRDYSTKLQRAVKEREVLEDKLRDAEAIILSLKDARSPSVDEYLAKWGLK